MSNIENSVITLKNFIEIFNERKTKGDIATIDVLGEKIYALENVLAEREQDKKRIKELEEALLKVKDKNVELFIHYKNSILKTKIKDLIENETINISGFKCIEVEDIEELLEDK